MSEDSGKVLLVDDDETLRGIVAATLGEQGLEVVEAADGEQGVAAALMHYPDLVISDIVMPVMSGWELCQTLRSLPSTRTVPFIFLTSLSEAPEKVLAARLGADDFLTKPFVPETLLERVMPLLERVKRCRAVVSGEGGETPAARMSELLVDTIEFLQASSRTGVVRVDDGRSRGLVYLKDGIPRHAVFGDLRGERALLAMLRIPDSRVAFREGEHHGLTVNLNLSWKEFMLSLSDTGAEETP